MKLATRKRDCHQENGGIGASKCADAIVLVLWMKRITKIHPSLLRLHIGFLSNKIGEGPSGYVGILLCRGEGGLVGGGPYEGSSRVFSYYRTSYSQYFLK